MINNIVRRRQKSVSGKSIHGVEWWQDESEGSLGWKRKWFKTWKARERFIKELKAKSISQPTSDVMMRVHQSGPKGSRHGKN